MIDKPYIRLLPQLSPKLAHEGLAVEVNEGEDLELNVAVEAYPAITEHKWHTPTSHKTSTQEHKLVKYNNRYVWGLFLLFSSALSVHKSNYQLSSLVVECLWHW